MWLDASIEGFDHVGLLANEPPGTAKLVLNESSDNPNSQSLHHRDGKASGLSFFLRLSIPTEYRIRRSLDPERGAQAAVGAVAYPNMPPGENWNRAGNPAHPGENMVVKPVDAAVPTEYSIRRR